MKGRHVMGQLTAGVRVERQTDTTDLLSQLGFGRVQPEQPLEPAEVVGAEHGALRENELKNRVVRYLRPVDQLVEHISVRAKRQDLSDYLNCFSEFVVEKTPIAEPPRCFSNQRPDSSTRSATQCSLGTQRTRGRVYLDFENVNRSRTVCLGGYPARKANVRTARREPGR